MIRVAYIVNSFSLGGLERCVARLVNGLDPERFEPLVIALTESGAAESWIERDKVPVLSMHKAGGNSWSFNRRLGEVLKQQRVDIAHSHNWATLLETSTARRMASTPVHVHAQRGMFFHGENDFVVKRWLRGKATRWAINRADCLVTVAESVREYWLSTYGATSTPVRVVTNGVHVPDHDRSGAAADSIRKQLGLTANDVVVGSMGRLVEVKAFQHLVEALSMIRDVRPLPHLVIVGDGPDRDALRNRAEALGIADRVHLVGEQLNVGDWLHALQLYVNCSLSEGMSQSILEAMAMGLPMVVTDAGENGVLAGGSNGCGIVVPIGNPAELSRAISHLCQSQPRCRELGQNALARHQACYSVGRMINDYESLYGELMSDQGAVTAGCHHSSDEVLPV